MKSQNRILGLYLIGLLFCSMTIWGQNSPPPQPLITAAQVDFVSGSVLISGKNLGNSKTFAGVASLFVPTRGNLQLAVLGFDPSKQELRVALPAGVTNLSGTLLLTVSTGPGAAKYDTFDLSLGAVGPQGPPGPAGPQGPKGPSGPQAPPSPGQTLSSTYNQGGPTENQVQLTAAHGDIRIFNDSVPSKEVLTLSQSGSVGIGTSNPDPNIGLTVGGDPPSPRGRIEVNTSDVGVLVTSTNPQFPRSVGQTLVGNLKKDSLAVGDSNRLALIFQSLDDASRLGSDVRFGAAVEAVVETRNTPTKGAGLAFLTSSNIGSQATEKVRITNDGEVGIGTSSPQGALDVNGTIFQRGTLLHADYVFEPSYPLESIEEHASFMWREKRLQGLPVAIQDEENRQVVELGSQQKGILEELEKAHVYIAQLSERIKTQELAMAKLGSLLAELAKDRSSTQGSKR